MAIPIYENTSRPVPEPLPKGSYMAEIAKIELTQTKESSKFPNHPMWKVTLLVDDGERNRRIFDYILLHEQWAWKLKALCESAGLEYSEDRSPDDFEGRVVKAKLTITKPTGQYGPGNAVDDYLARQDGDAVPSPARAAASVEDDRVLPF